MLENLEKIFSVLRRVTLSERERQNMRIHLQSHMREHPVQQTVSQRWYTQAVRMLQTFERSFNSPRFFTHPIFATFVLVLCASAGTSYAARGALPGESLYSFKTHINEQIEGVLAFSPAAKAHWSAELTNRRLLEAEELVVTGELSPVAQAEIETGINLAVKKFNSNLTLLSVKDDAGAANAQSDFEASLNAHETVLASLPAKKKSDTTNIASLVRLHAEQVSKDRSVFESMFTATNSAAVRTAALNQKKSAENAIQRAKKFSAQSIDTHVASSVVSVAISAESDVQAGENDAQQGKWGRAFSAFQDATRKVKETEDGVDTRKWLKKKFGIGLDASATTTVEQTLSDDIDDESGDTSNINKRYHNTVGNDDDDSDNQAP